MKIAVVERKLGKLCISFSILELYVKALTGIMINKDGYVGMVITSEMSFQKIVQLLDGLLRKSPFRESTTIAIQALIPRINSVEQIRNKLVHSLYAGNPIQKTVYRIKSTAKLGKGLKHQEGEVDIKEFDDVITEIKLLSKEFGKIWPSVLKNDIWKEFSER